MSHSKDTDGMSFMYHVNKIVVKILISGWHKLFLSYYMFLYCINYSLTT